MELSKFFHISASVTENRNRSQALSEQDGVERSIRGTVTNRDLPSSAERESER